MQVFVTDLKVDNRVHAAIAKHDASTRVQVSTRGSLPRTKVQRPEHLVSTRYRPRTQLANRRRQGVRDRPRFLGLRASCLHNADEIYDGSDNIVCPDLLEPWQLPRRIETFLDKTGVVRNGDQVIIHERPSNFVQDVAYS